LEEKEILKRNAGQSRRSPRWSCLRRRIAAEEEAIMELEGVGVTEPDGTKYVLTLKFGKQLSGKQLYVTAELRRGEDAAAVAMTLREMAAQVEARSE
jgi:hypothetical protein